MAKGDFNVATISKPIALTHPDTFMECLLNDYRYADQFLNLAARTQDPLERL